jgi:hypothetical protein
MKFLTVPTTMQCLVCRDRINARSPYPQLCDACRKKPSRSLVAAMHTEIDRLANTWGKLVTPELEPRFTKMLEVAAELSVLMSPFQRMDAMQKFSVRVVKTIEQGGDFAGLVEAWWTHRIRKDDLRSLEVQLAWAKIQGDDGDGSTQTN